MKTSLKITTTPYGHSTYRLHDTPEFTGIPGHPFRTKIRRGVLNPITGLAGVVHRRRQHETRLHNTREIPSFSSPLASLMHRTQFRRRRGLGVPSDMSIDVKPGISITWAEK